MASNYHVFELDDRPLLQHQASIVSPLRRRLFDGLIVVLGFLKNATYKLFYTKRHLTKRISAAILLLFVFATLPMILWFRLVKNPFEPLPVVCSTGSADSNLGNVADPLDTPTGGGTQDGIQSLFTIDRTFGSLPFWIAKLIDTMWDLFVARGVQFLVGWASYEAFSSAMLRAMEFSAIPYDTFRGLSLTSPSIASTWLVMKSLSRFHRRRLLVLFTYIAISMVYVVALPTLLTATTGYINSSAAFVTMPGTVQLIPITSIYSAAIVALGEGGRKYCSTDERAEVELNERAKRWLTCCK